MAKSNNVMPLGATAAGLATGVIWTVVAGTVWQWIPIGAAIAVVYGVARSFEAEEKSKAPGSKHKPKKGDKCC